MKNFRGLLSRCALLLSAAALLVSILCSCSQSKNVIMKIGSFEVTFEHYRYLYMNIRDALLDSETEFTDEALDAEVRDTVMQSLLHYASVTEMAKKRDVSLSADDQKEIDDFIKSSIESYGSEEEFRKALQQSYETEEFFRYALELGRLETKLRAFMSSEYTGELDSDDTTIERDVYANFCRAKQILIQNDEGDDKTANAELAKEVLAKALAGEDFDLLIKEFGEDKSGGEYCFTTGQLLEEFESAVRSVSVGEIVPEVVETEAGYHIIMRTEITPDYINENFNDLRQAYIARRFNELQKECTDSFEIKKSDIFDSLTAENFISGAMPADVSEKSETT